ncbi:MAG: mechanosensitive ion channel family protein [Dehalococcoidia bacterium]|nr:mechanosensitive ion channel family protein [Dehalococcoidia bacterium]MDD5493337.1 mechanosensitive ion channel family protein [Dehalococcoidia bacterium]
MSAFNFEDKILEISIIAISGLAVFLVTFFLLKMLAKRVMSADQYIQLKHQPIVWIVPIIVGFIILFIQVILATQYLGKDFTPILQGAGSWVMQHGILILIIALTAVIACKVISYILPNAMRNYVEVRNKGRNAREEVTKRSDMLSNFLIRILEALVYLMAIFIILSELGINIAPLLAGAGVVGIAVGLASQKFIGDIINGTIIIIEDYFSVGDVVQIAGIAGLVEEVNLRRTVLRNLDGIVHIIPNGEIKIASNFTRNWSRVNLNIPVSYNEDLDKVISVLNRVGMEMAKDKQFRSMIITPPQVLRVDNFGDSAIEIKMLGETEPMKQWDVTGELRRRVKKVFDEEHIEIPWPHTKVYFGNSPGEVKGPPDQNSHPAGHAKLKRRKQPLPPADSEET